MIEAPLPTLLYISNNSWKRSFNLCLSIEKLKEHNVFWMGLTFLLFHWMCEPMNNGFRNTDNNITQTTFQSILSKCFSLENVLFCAELLSIQISCFTCFLYLILQRKWKSRTHVCVQLNNQISCKLITESRLNRSVIVVMFIKFAVFHPKTFLWNYSVLCLSVLY